MKKFHDSDVKGVLFTNQISVDYFNQIQYPNRHLGFTKNRLFSQNSVFYIQRNSIWRRAFDKKLEYFDEAGFIKQLVNSYLNNRGIQSFHDNKPHELEMVNIFAAFEICFFVYVISLIVFILEVISNRYRFIKIFIDFLTY